MLRRARQRRVEIVARFVRDSQDGVTFSAEAFMLGQLESVPWHHLVHCAGAFKVLDVELMRLQHQFAMHPGCVAVRVAPFTAAVVYLQYGQLAGIEFRRALGGMGNQLFRVPAAARDRVRLNPPQCCELVNGVMGVGGAHAVETQLGVAGHFRNDGLAVENDELVVCVRGRGCVRLLVLKTPAQALGRQDALQKIEIGFAVLVQIGRGASCWSMSNSTRTCG